VKISLIGLCQSAANELEREYKKRQRIRAKHGNCDCAICCDESADHAGLYAYCLRELADNATKLKNNPSRLDEFLDRYALRQSGPTPAGDQVNANEVER